MWQRSDFLGLLSILRNKNIYYRISIDTQQEQIEEGRTRAMAMAMSSFRIVFRHILHTKTNNRFFTPPPRTTWRHSLLSSRISSSTNYSYNVITNKDERLLEQIENDNNNTNVVANSTTIAAIVTSLGGPPAAVGIVRLSGPHAVSIAGRVFRPARNTWRPTSHVVEYGVVLDSDGNVVDEVIAVPMLAPRSYTREDVVELQCHGNEVCLRRVLRICLEAGATLAQPGMLIVINLILMFSAYFNNLSRIVYENSL